MNFKRGMNILTSSCYTRCKLRAPPISGVGGVSGRVDLVWKSLFYASLWLLTARDRRLAAASILTLDPWSRRPKLLTSQVGSLGLLRLWNGDSLKTAKKTRFSWSGPFSHILPHNMILKFNTYKCAGLALLLRVLPCMHKCSGLLLHSFFQRKFKQFYLQHIWTLTINNHEWKSFLTTKDHNFSIIGGVTQSPTKCYNISTTKRTVVMKPKCRLALLC